MQYNIGYVNGLFAALQIAAGVLVGWKLFQLSEYPKRYKDPDYMFGLFIVFTGALSWVLISFGMLDMAYLSVAQHFKFSWPVEAAAQLQYMKIYPAAYILTQVILVLNVRWNDDPRSKLRRGGKPRLKLVVNNF